MKSGIAGKYMLQLPVPNNWQHIATTAASMSVTSFMQYLARQCTCVAIAYCMHLVVSEAR